MLSFLHTLQYQNYGNKYLRSHNPSGYTQSTYRSIIAELRTLIEDYICKFKVSHPDPAVFSNYAWEFLYDAISTLWRHNYFIIVNGKSCNESCSPEAQQILTEELILLMDNSFRDTRYFTAFFAYAAGREMDIYGYQKIIRSFSLSKLNGTPFEFEAHGKKLQEQRLIKNLEKAQKIITELGLTEKYGPLTEQIRSIVE